MRISRAARQEKSSSRFPELEPIDQSVGGLTAPGVAPRLRVVPSEDDTSVALKPRATILSFSNMYRYGDLWANFMRARKKVFVDRLGWALPVADGMEFDQYDTPYCRWAIIHDYGEILAGVRLTPTTAKVGLHSYMLRDAQLGLLNDIPRDVLFFEAPVEDRIAEASRLFVTGAVPASRRTITQIALMDAFATAARGMGATHVIGIVPAAWSRWLRRLDMGATPVGPRFEIDGFRSQAALFNVLKHGR